MERIPTLRTRLLDLAAGIGFAGPVLMVLATFDLRDAWVNVVVSALIACEVVIWVLWRRTGQRSRVLATVFCLLAATAMMFGNGVLFYGIIWAACLVLSVSFSSSATLWVYAAALVALTTLLHLSSGNPFETVLAESVGTAVLGGVAAAMGGVLRDSLRVSEVLQAAVGQRDAANAELRRRLGTDRELVLAQERERMARELHDELGHRLTALGLSLDFAGRTSDADAAREEISWAREVVGDSLASMRTLVRAMHPIDLGDLHDADALRAVAEAFRGSGLGVRVTVRGDESAPLPHDVSLLLLRFAQEGLTNVVRHAHAAEADLDVEVDGAGVRAVLTDRGGAASGPVAWGFGLRSLRDRAIELGGRLEAERTDGGFRLAVAVPRGADTAAVRLADAAAAPAAAQSPGASL